VQPGVIKSCASRYIRRVTPMVETGYRSSAGYAAEMGTDNGGTSGTSR
jgi:hypothetical protein